MDDSVVRINWGFALPESSIDSDLPVGLQPSTWPVDCHDDAKDCRCH